MISLLAICHFLFYLTTISAEKKCCTGVNMITKKKCVDGSNITELHCENKYLIYSSDEELSIDKNDNLVSTNLESLSGRYCSTKLNETGEVVYLVCFEEDKFGDAAMQTNQILAFISSIFMALTVAIYLRVPNLLDLQGICIVHSISGLTISFFVLAINQFSLDIPSAVCHFLSYLTYFAFLYAFFWLNILSFHIWRTTVKPKVLGFTNRWSLTYHIIGTVGPIIFLIFLMTAHHSNLKIFDGIKPGIAEGRCWFKSLRETLIYFYGPITVLICVNIFYYVWTIYVLWKQMNRSDIKKTKIMKFRLILCIKLFFIMGITWGFEVLSAVLENSDKAIRIIWFITDILNGLQGILIFLILVIFRKKVLKGLANQKICNLQLPSKWKHVADDECDEEEDEELSLSAVSPPAPS